VTTLACLFLSIGLAWHLATSPKSHRVRLFAILCVPFFINLIARVYALRSLFAHEGPVAFFIEAMGWTSIDLFALSQNSFLVFYGMIVTYLPFMLFPVFVAMDSFDFSQVEAVYDLGGGPWTALRKVILPQIMPALATGCMMVLVPATGEYVIPDLLGGAKVMLLGNLITDQFLKSRDWPFGAVLAIELMMILVFFLALTFKKKQGDHG
jgi:spermidine/putrescine transport system permease protein